MDKMAGAVSSSLEKVESRATERERLRLRQAKAARQEPPASNNARLAGSGVDKLATRTPMNEASCVGESYSRSPEVRPAGKCRTTRRDEHDRSHLRCLRSTGKHRRPCHTCRKGRGSPQRCPQASDRSLGRCSYRNPRSSHCSSRAKTSELLGRQVALRGIVPIARVSPAADVIGRLVPFIFRGNEVSGPWIAGHRHQAACDVRRSTCRIPFRSCRGLPVPLVG